MIPTTVTISLTVKEVRTIEAALLLELAHIRHGMGRLEDHTDPAHALGAVYELLKRDCDNIHGILQNLELSAD